MSDQDGSEQAVRIGRNHQDDMRIGHLLVVSEVLRSRSESHLTISQRPPSQIAALVEAHLYHHGSSRRCLLSLGNLTAIETI